MNILHRITKPIHNLLQPYGFALMSDGFLVKVRRLELYELDAVEHVDLGPFVYEYVNQKSGRVMKRPYDISAWAEPPTKPRTPEHECDPDSMDAALWHVYSTYQAALLHTQKQIEKTQEHVHDCARYILDNCVSERALAHITSPVDYVAVYELAAMPEVKEEDIRHVLADTFRGLIPGDADIGRLAGLAQRRRQDSNIEAVGATSYEMGGA